MHGAGTYREVGFTYASGSGGGAAEEGSAAHGAEGADAAAAGRQPEAPHYVPRFDVPIPARLVGRLPHTVREQKVGLAHYKPCTFNRDTLHLGLHQVL